MEMPRWSLTLNDRTTTYVHDAAGRLRFEIMPDLSFRENVYDALNQVSTDTAVRFQAAGQRLRAPKRKWSRCAATAPSVMAAPADRRTLRRSRQAHQHHRCVGQYRAVRVQHVRRSHADGSTRTATAGPASTTARGRRSTRPRRRCSSSSAARRWLRRRPNRVLETRFAYDAFGNLIQKIEAANFPNDARTTDFLYDTVGRPTSTHYHRLLRCCHRQSRKRSRRRTAFRREATTIYDTLGNAVRTSIRTGVNAFQHTYRTYDRQGQVVHEVNALNNVTRYTLQLVRRARDGDTLQRDDLGHAGERVYWTAAEVDPQLNWGHDENGNLIEDAYARTITLAYDQLGRKSARDAADRDLSTPRAHRATPARPITSGRMLQATSPACRTPPSPDTSTTPSATRPCSACASTTSSSGRTRRSATTPWAAGPAASMRPATSPP